MASFVAVYFIFLHFLTISLFSFSVSLLITFPPAPHLRFFRFPFLLVLFLVFLALLCQEPKVRHIDP